MATQLSLNPCSNGMTIEYEVIYNVLLNDGLNPCSNGMTIEFDT